MRNTSSFNCSCAKPEKTLPAVQRAKNVTVVHGTRGSLPCLQEAATGTYPEPSESRPTCIPDFFQINYNSILSSVSPFQDIRLKFRKHLSCNWGSEISATVVTNV